MGVPLWKTLLWTLLISCLPGCSPAEKQHTVEAQTIFGVIRLLPIYEHSYPAVPITNLAQMITGLERDYPYGWHQGLMRFGKYAGFTNSIYEKYIFFPPGVTNPKFEGELLLMNARPYPSANGKMGRTVVSKAAGIYHRNVLREERIQQVFKEAGIVEPKAVTMPPPPVPLKEEPIPISIKVSRFFMKAADFLGISQHWLLLRNATVVASLVMFTWLGGYLLFSRVRRR